MGTDHEVPLPRFRAVHYPQASAKTGEDIRRNHPDRFEGLVSRGLTSQLRQAKEHEKERERFSEHMSQTVLLPHFELDDDLSKQIIMRLAPFSSEGKLRPHSVNAGRRAISSGTRADWAMEFMKDSASRSRASVQITMDGHKAYFDAVDDAFEMPGKL